MRFHGHGFSAFLRCHSGPLGCRCLGRGLVAAMILGRCLVGGMGSVSAADHEPAMPRISLAGTLSLPDSLPTGGPEITGVSGVTWLGNDRYAAVLDNSDQLLFFQLTVLPNGQPREASDMRIVTLGERHDYEDLAPCPPLLAERIAARRLARGASRPTHTLLVCEEDTPAIRGIDSDRGDLLGVVPIPEIFKRRRTNRGLEALSVDPDGRFIWSATEEAVPDDGPASGEGQPTVVRIARIPVPGAADGDSAGQFAYAVDPPHAFARIFAGEPLAGLVAMVALGQGRLLVLERSAAPGLPPFNSRITLVDTSQASDVADLSGGLAKVPNRHLEKVLLWQDALGCNLEGLCLGPQLADGSRLLVGVADNGGLGTPTQLVTLVLHEGPEPADASLLGIAAVAAGTVLLVLRVTSP